MSETGTVRPNPAITFVLSPYLTLMKRFLKISAIVLVTLLILLITLPYLFRGKIVEAIKKAANDNLEAVVDFNKVSLSLIRNFPNLRVTIDGFTVDNVAPFEGVRLASIGQLEAVVDIKSVFGDEIMIRRIALIEPAFDVRVLSDGRANYDIAKADTTTTLPETPEAEEGAPLRLRVEDFTVSRLMLNYQDATMPLKFILHNMDFNASGGLDGDITTWKATAHAEEATCWMDGITYLRKAEFSADAEIEANLKESKYTLRDNLMRLNELELKADGWLSMPGDDIDMDFTFGAAKTDFRHLLSLVPLEFAKDLKGVEASGKMGVDGYVRGTYNDKSLPGVGLDLVVENGRFKYPDLPKSVDNVQVRMSVVADLNVMDRTTVDVDRFYLEMAGNPVDMRLKLRTPESDPDIDFACKAFIDLDNVSEFIPLESGDKIHGQINADFVLIGRMSSIEKERYDQFKAEGLVGIRNVLFSSDSLSYNLHVNTADFVFTPAFINLENFNSTIGRSDLSASGRITDYLSYALRDSLLTGRFTVSSKLLDLNEFMSAEEIATDPSQSTSEAEEVPMAAIELPGNIDFVLNATCQRMLYGINEISDVKGTVGLRDKQAFLKDVKMNVLEGTVAMSGNYDARNLSKPKMDMAFDIRDMDINKAATQFATIDKMAPIAKACNGRFSSKFTLKSDLQTDMMPINPSVNGMGSLSTRSVTVKDFEPLVKLAEKINYEKLRQPLTVNDINLAFKIVDGVVTVDPFTVKLDGVPAKVYGSTTLDQVIDYNVEMDVPFDRFPSAAVNQASSFIGEINKKLGSNLSVGTKVNVIARITGTVTDPKIGVTSKALGADAVKDLKEQAVEAIKEEVKEKITDLRNEALEKAIAEKERLVREAQSAADQVKREGREASQRVKDEAYKLAKQTEDSAKNPLEKQAMKLAADKIRKEADEAFNRAVAETDKRANNLVKEAEARGDKMIEDANAKSDSQINKIN